MLRHIYVVLEHYEDHLHFEETFVCAFTSDVKATQFAKINYDVDTTTTISNSVIYRLTEPNRSVEVRLVKLDPNVRKS